MKTKIIYTLIIFLSNSFLMNVFGNNYFSQITPPSSDASALGKYGQYPVALYNGLVNNEMKENVEFIHYIVR